METNDTPNSRIMKTLKITKKDIKETEFYYKEYIGEDVSNFNGNIEIEKNLGYIKFISIKANGSIIAGNGSGIKAGWGIEAKQGIEAGWGIEAGQGIKAGWGIEAGQGIEAGSGIEAGQGIKAGLSITCKQSLKAGYRIFAGTALWLKEVSEEQKTITCEKLESGEIAYGILKENKL